MRKFFKALAFMVSAFVALGLLAPAASAQADDATETAEECIDTVVTITTRPTFRSESVQTTEYPDRVIQSNVLIPGTVDVEETEEVVVPCPDEVLSIVELPSTPLAVTGSNLSFPLALGFSLVGLGGIALSVARKSEAYAARTV